MIRTSQKSPEALDQNKRKTLQRCWATLRFLIEPCLRFFEGLQGRSHEIFIRLRRRLRPWPWRNALICDIPFQRSIYHASADFAYRRVTQRSLGVGGYGFEGPRACPWGSIKRVSEERAVLHESQSKAVIGPKARNQRRVSCLCEKKEKDSYEGQPFRQTMKFYFEFGDLIFVFSGIK